MRARFNARQLLIVAAIVVAVAFSGIVAHHVLGPVGMVVPIAVGAGALSLLLIESRYYQQLLFTRTLTEQRRTYAQLEALLAVLRATDPVLPLPAMRSWAASPDLLRELVHHILTQRPRTVVEASCGASTIVMAYALKRVGGGKVVALEHDALYAGRTRQAIVEHGLQDFAEVRLAPLVKHRIGHAEHLWYDIGTAALPEGIELLVVDGPPETVQDHARYPALPLLKHALAPGALVVLDDGARADERAIAERWSKLVPGAELRYMELEAGAWFLRCP